jgi:hypothetical protein
MDTMKLLLGATVALLLGALAVSWQGMNSGMKNAPQDDLARINKQLADLRMQNDRLLIEKQLQEARASTPQIPTPMSNAAEIEAMKAQIARGKEAIADLEAEKAKRDADLAQAEQGLINQRDVYGRDPELKQASLIAQALLIGKVLEYSEDPQYGGFATFTVLMPEQVQVGTILAIRRKTGILGQLKVSDVTPEGGIANPLPGVAPFIPKPGDELILPPPF